MVTAASLLSWGVSVVLRSLLAPSHVPLLLSPEKCSDSSGIHRRENVFEGGTARGFWCDDLACDRAFESSVPDRADLMSFVFFSFFIFKIRGGEESGMGGESWYEKRS